MTTIPPPAPTAIAEGTASDQDPNKCFACAPPLEHDRVWISNPKTSDPEHPRSRTLVLCFDGTGDLSKDHVSQFFSPSYPWSRLELNAVPTELQRRATLQDVKG